MEKREKANNSWHNGGKRDKGEGKWLTEGQSAFYVCAYMYLEYNTYMYKNICKHGGGGVRWGGGGVVVFALNMLSNRFDKK